MKFLAWCARVDPGMAMHQKQQQIAGHVALLRFTVHSAPAAAELYRSATGGETLAMKTRFRSEDDGWTVYGRKITAPKALDAIRRSLDEEGPIIVEHWFYRGSCAPDRAVFNDFEALSDYLDAHASGGDSIHIWSFAAVCRDDNGLASGKCPDDNGLFPTRGAY